MSQVTETSTQATATATDNTQANATTTTNETETFTPLTPAQQKHMDEIIRQRMGKAAAEVRKENEDLKKRVQTLESTTSTATTSETDDNKDTKKSKEEEYRRIADQRARDAEAARKEADAARKDAEAARNQAVEVQKRYEISNAAAKQSFISLDDVVALTEKFIKHEDGKFVVVNETGEPRYNLAYQPMTPEEFYADYATKKPHLVASSARTGTGASGSQRSLVTGSKYQIDQVFGPKSDAGLANKLSKENPVEYARLRKQAVDAGLLRR